LPNRSHPSSCRRLDMTLHNHLISALRSVARPIRRSVRNFASLRARLRDLGQTTYCAAEDVRIEPVLATLGTPQFSPAMQEIGNVLTLLLEHRFDLFGSCWQEVSHGAECRGLEGYNYKSEPIYTGADGKWLSKLVNASNLKHSRQLWHWIEQPYQAIDWQRDFISGWRWNESTWYRDITVAPKAGADIKVPWELGRMQHLPLLAWGYAQHPRKRQTYAREFRNQVLDFMASNPPRFGVNWASALEPAIRVTNWLVAYDLFRSNDATFDSPFETAFAASVYDHAEFITSNLETRPFCGNHYLGNIVGLLFSAAHLAPSEQADKWLAFASSEFVKAIHAQFNQDGTNFEGSTAYHCFSAEMVIYGAAVLIGIPEQRRRLLQHRFGLSDSQFCNGLYSVETTLLLRRIINFVAAIRDANGEIPQIGDNDSARFLKLEPEYRLIPIHPDNAATDVDQVWTENSLARLGLIDAGRALFGRTFAPTSLDAYVVRLLSRGKMLGCTVLEVPGTTQSLMEWDEISARARLLPAQQRRTYTFELDPDCLLGFEQFAFNDFGLYVIRTPRMRLVFRCGSIGQRGIGGHSHDDQLSVDLLVDGHHLLIDPGTYVYTPLPERRNEYRSAQAHNGPRPEGKGLNFDRVSMFNLGRDGLAGTCVHSTPGRIAGYLLWPDVSAWRSIDVRSDAIVISDWIEGDFRGWEKYVRLPHSRGYGLREPMEATCV
jgi:hypothetical protein